MAGPVRPPQTPADVTPTRRTILTALALTPLLTGAARVPIPTVHDDLLLPWGGPDNPAIFVHAHQDDDTLTFGPDAELHSKAGRHVQFVCVTDGRASAVRSRTGLSVKDFSQARTREYLAAVSKLWANEVQFAGLMDGATTVAQTTALATLLTLRYPRASFKVPSWRDNHPDHANIGLAFKALKVGNNDLDVRWYVKPEQRGEAETMSGTTRVPGGDRTLQAIAEYRRVQTSAGRYGIGELSVPASFDMLEADNASYWHA